MRGVGYVGRGSAGKRPVGDWELRRPFPPRPLVIEPEQRDHKQRWRDRASGRSPNPTPEPAGRGQWVGLDFWLVAYKSKDDDGRDSENGPEEQRFSGRAVV
jgi:hypothetical protein